MVSSSRRFLIGLNSLIAVGFLVSAIVGRNKKTKKTEKTIHEKYEKEKELTNPTRSSSDSSDRDNYSGGVVYMPNYIPPPNEEPYNQDFYATPQLYYDMDNNNEPDPKDSSCAFPQNEAYFIRKSQLSSSPNCRLSPLRMSFEKNPCDRPYVDLGPAI
jgi:hypothetical protein